jgi:hypothetical protein
LQSQADFTFVSRFDREEKIIAVTNWAAENDKSVGRQRVHERSVPFSESQGHFDEADYQGQLKNGVGEAQK